MKDSVKFEKFRVIQAAAIAVEPLFTLFVPGFEDVCPFYQIQNNSDLPVYISYDGITNHDYLQTNLREKLRIKTSGKMGQPSNFKGILAKGTKIYLSVPATYVGPAKGYIDFSAFLLIR